jgi:short subunit dehydrogenase-like uncharacterized protein
MSDPLMIYGASGYTGRLVTRGAVELGLRPVLAGRDEDRLAKAAAQFGLEYRVVRLGDPAGLDRALGGVAAVVHVAGPFSETAPPMVDACLRRGVHYLDITGEVRVIEDLATRSAEARRRGVMLMPGVGFDVVASDCLAAHVAKRLPGAEHLALGVKGLWYMTRGSAKTLAQAAGDGLVRRGGVIQPAPQGSLERSFDYGNGPRRSLNVSWGDVASAYYTTGIPNLEVYQEATPPLEALLMTGRIFGWALRTAPWQVWLRAWADLLPEGPSEAERAARRMVLVAEARDRRGRRAVARLRTPEAYTFTGMAAPAVARRVVGGDVEIGFQTPARIYGSDFVLSLAGVSREDVA